MRSGDATQAQLDALLRLAGWVPTNQKPRTQGEWEQLTRQAAYQAHYLTTVYINAKIEGMPQQTVSIAARNAYRAEQRRQRCIKRCRAAYNTSLLKLYAVVTKRTPKRSRRLGVQE